MIDDHEENDGVHKYHVMYDDGHEEVSLCIVQTTCKYGFISIKNKIGCAIVIARNLNLCIT